MPPRTPSSLSRDKAGWTPRLLGVESILGKRKSQQSPLPGRPDTRHPPPPPDEGGHDESFSDSYVEDEPRNINKVQKVAGPSDTLSATSTAPPHPASTTLDPPLVNQNHIFKSRIVRRRRSISTRKCAYDVVREDLKSVNGSDAGIATLSYQQKHNPGFPIVYRIDCDDERSRFRHHETIFYEDDPLLANIVDGKRSSHLSGSRPIYQLQNYVRHFRWPSFVIVKNRECGEQAVLSSLQNNRDETMLILGDDLRRALQSTATCSLAAFVKRGSFEFRAPYQHLYFHRELLQSHKRSVNVQLRGEIEAVLEYVITNHGKDYVDADKLLSQGKMTLRHLDKIFRPNDHVVFAYKSKENGLLRFRDVYVLKDWPYIRDSAFTMQCWSWKFTPWECTRSTMTISLPMPVEDENESFPLDELGFRPISILSEESIETLRNLGRKSWNLRHPSFVYCTGSDRVKPSRYMIDRDVYVRLHSTEGITLVSKTRNKQTDPWPLEIGFHEKPTEDEFLMMPTHLPGYDLLEKEWVNLPVADITSIDWRKQPFEDLVLPEETKRLVRAMVTVRASSIKTKREQMLRTNYDIISGKGNGLIMLFHGSPGTGKTLTAESVAEIAEMPLYPITCGDIGTEPEKVEEYLRLVFELGSRWNCVLLLDEADVFLEERTLADLQRNSLVSVFLRMLEYYEGILILTSNRVGTFDEAFRSRINIALHYEDLKPRSRRLIWSNFLARLEGTEDGENVAEIERRLDELANHKLNGREIRNALSTARQLASYEGKVMGWEHLELAIKTANKFGNYLREVHGHSDRDWAKERRERL